MATEPVECGMRPVHPGEILREELAELGLPARAVAKALAIPTNRVTQILKRAARGHGRHGAPPRPLLRHLGRVLDGPARRL